MRKDYLDIAKGLGILLVVTGHALELYLGEGGNPAVFTAWKFIYSFHMPLFFLLSGLAAPRLADTTLQKTLSGALYLLFVATLLQLAFAPLRLAFAAPGDTAPASLPEAIRSVLWPAVKLEGYALAVIWFLPCLAIRLAIWLVGNATRKAAAGVVGVLCLLCIAEHDLGVGYLQLRSVIVGMAFFAIGQRVGNLPLDPRRRAACWGGFAAGLLLTTLTFDANHGCTFSPARACPGPRDGEFIVVMASGAFGFLPLFALTSLAGAAAVLSAALLLTAAPGARWLARIGRRTLELLVVNGVVLAFVQPALSRQVADLSPPFVVASLVLAQLAACFALHPVLDRFLALARHAAARLAFVQAPAATPFSRTPR